MNPFLIAWRVARWLPRSWVRAIAWLLVMYAWVAKAKPARRLEENYARVTGLSGKPLRRLGRRGLASVARYYAETFEMSRLTVHQLDARVRIDNPDALDGVFSEDRGTVAVLGHLGNWDLVGAYACRHIIPVTAVAEVLEPREVFDEFVALRERWGLRILGHEGGATFRELIRIARSERTLVCLLSDRDLSGSGIPVTMWGHEVKVAPGPAALAQSVRTVILPVMIRYERLSGRQRLRARSRWGVVLHFGEVVRPDDFTGDNRLADMTQAWATQIADFVGMYTEDWHMLQRFGWVVSP